MEQPYGFTPQGPPAQHSPSLSGPWFFVRFCLHPWTRYLVTWALVLWLLIVLVLYAWNAYYDEGRNDKNSGHVAVDFGSQYLMARMIVTGNGRELYHRSRQREALEPVMPKEDGNSKESNDVETLLTWTMATKDAEGHETDIAGPLYPPVQAVMFAPLGLLPARPAYRLMQVIIFLLVLLDGWIIEQISRGKLWWPVAVALLLVFPGFNGTSCLAQNPQWTITFLLLGWWLLQQNRPVLGGMVWALMAYKPVWAVAFALAPLVTGRWRFLLSMMVTGALLCLATLPIVGWQTWWDWWQVGNVGAYEYTRQQNWIFLSRDLVSIPRRWMLTFKDRLAIDPEEQPLPTTLGTVLWVEVVVLTALIVLWALFSSKRREQVLAMTGPGAAFLLLGSYFFCFHFMYYDVTVAVLPVVLLFTEPWQYLKLKFLSRRPASAVDLEYYKPTLATLVPPELPLESGWRPRWVVSPLPPLMLLGLLITTPICIHFDREYMFPPVDTYWLLVIWAWCGWQVIRGPYTPRLTEGQADAPEASEKSDKIMTAEPEAITLPPALDGAVEGER
jgi:hypothetical protein